MSSANPNDSTQEPSAVRGPPVFGSDLIGQTIGGHKIDSLLGQGGMGAVYRAFDDALGRHVAIKIIRPELAHGHMLDRFMREARALAKMSHPNLLAIHSIGFADDLGGIPYFVMEYIEGRSLSEYLHAQGKPRPEEVAELCGEILAALSHVHGEGITHRDLKPSNIMIRGSDRRAILMDFGIAKVDDAQGLTTEGIVLGTPEYMSPEQADSADVDPRSDIYSFGIMLYEIFNGAVPFKGKSTFSILRQQVEARPAPLGEKCSALWENVIFRCIEKIPKDRFPSVNHLAEALVQEYPLAALQDLAARADKTVATLPVSMQRAETTDDMATADTVADERDDEAPTLLTKPKAGGTPIRNSHLALLPFLIPAVLAVAVSVMYATGFGLRSGDHEKATTSGNEASTVPSTPMQESPAGKILIPGSEPIPGKIVSVTPTADGKTKIQYLHEGKLITRLVDRRFEIEIDDLQPKSID